MKIDTMTHIAPLQRKGRKNFEFLKIQEGGSRLVENHKNRDISATVKPICTKFGSLVQNWSPNRSDR